MAKTCMILGLLTVLTPILALEPRLATHSLLDSKPKNGGVSRLADSRSNASLHFARGLDRVDGLALLPRQSTCPSGHYRCPLGAAVKTIRTAPRADAAISPTLAAAPMAATTQTKKYVVEPAVPTVNLDMSACRPQAAVRQATRNAAPIAASTPKRKFVVLKTKQLATRAIPA
ncbi:uncharacterized protein BDV17DRAFT_295187 [Aspergillus undulatus]|uniref:uncharacterized protein n=1 Tax=Aspergillus undulatus TaxID=1810928 RepID=UPI003CCD7087